MNQSPGAIALVGSGEYSVMMQELETELLHRAISRGKKNTFAQIPTASSHEGDISRAKWKRLGQEQSDRVASFITKNTSGSTLIGIDENTALVHTDAWRKYGVGKVHILRGVLEIQ